MLKSEDVKKVARKCGADVVGIGSMDRFDGAPKQMDPRYIMPDAKAIIGLGFRIHRGLLRGIEEGTFFAAYTAMGYAQINDGYAPKVLREVGNFLEDNGYEAMLYQNTSVRLGPGAGRAVAPEKPMPDVFIHFRIAAFICGMGEIGYSKLFLTPEFGPRQRFAFILTDAPLEPDPIYEGPPICDRCMLCVKECPAGAISRNETVRVKIAGRTLEWGKLDVLKCTACYQAGTPEYSPFMPEKVAKTLERIFKKGSSEQEGMMDYTGDIWAYLREEFPYIHNAWLSYHHPANICGGRGCIRACMMHLEKEGRIKNLFHSPFRKRKPWKLGREEV